MSLFSMQMSLEEIYKSKNKSNHTKYCQKYGTLTWQRRRVSRGQSSTGKQWSLPDCRCQFSADPTSSPMSSFPLSFFWAEVLQWVLHLSPPLRWDTSFRSTSWQKKQAWGKRACSRERQNICATVAVKPEQSIKVIVKKCYVMKQKSQNDSNMVKYINVTK